MRMSQRNGTETYTKWIPPHEVTLKPEITEATATLTCPKGRPHREGNRRSKQVRSTMGPIIVTQKRARQTG